MDTFRIDLLGFGDLPPEAATRRVAEAFRIDPSEAENIVATAPVTLKAGLSEPKTLGFVRVLVTCGASVQVVHEPSGAVEIYGADVEESEEATKPAEDRGKSILDMIREEITSDQPSVREEPMAEKKLLDLIREEITGDPPVVVAVQSEPVRPTRPRASALPREPTQGHTTDEVLIPPPLKSSVGMPARKRGKQLADALRAGGSKKAEAEKPKRRKRPKFGKNRAVFWTRRRKLILVVTLALAIAATVHLLTS